MPLESSDLSDSQLIVELQSGDMDALGALYERYKTDVYRIALGITHDPSTAEDVLQDCFLRIYDYAYRIDTSLPLRPWLYRVTVNLTYNVERRRKRWHTPVDSVLESLLEWLVSSPLRLTERQVEFRHAKSEVLDAIASLSINHRVVIVLYYLKCLSVKEVATILNCPVGTVKSRLYHGRKNLRRKLMAKHGGALELSYGVSVQ